MIGHLFGRLGAAVTRVQLLLDASARLEAVEHENAEILGRVMDLESDLEDVEAHVREFYGVTPIEQEASDRG